ncbi:hypothetical protein [Kribbella solani]|uniref:Uncharacterized protein n=1 Tax=Kribbella solani TaxID=236067 RepID=A0A841DYJ0_9ACTN|nr:hypothetical protein [Kribbella solani]MBB5980298.1 hypothetical protein [Kribbella solani]
MIGLHLGGVPEAAMVLGPIALIVAFLRIARRNEANLPDDEDEYADLGDLPDRVTRPDPDKARGPADTPAVRRASPRTPSP